jgi:hypothetical protein
MVTTGMRTHQFLAALLGSADGHAKIARFALVRLRQAIEPKLKTAEIKPFIATDSLSTDLLSRPLRLCGVDRETMSESLGQLDDVRHERHILEVSEQIEAARRRGDHRLARALWASLTVLLSTRSPRQVARMEQQKGLRFEGE